MGEEYTYPRWQVYGHEEISEHEQTEDSLKDGIKINVRE